MKETFQNLGEFNLDWNRQPVFCFLAIVSIALGSSLGFSIVGNISIQTMLIAAGFSLTFLLISLLVLSAGTAIEVILEKHSILEESNSLLSAIVITFASAGIPSFLAACIFKIAA